MITPFFTISQDDEFIFIDVKVSHIRFNAQSIEMVVQDELFIFALPPYYLRLRLPFRCVDDERSHAAYDSKSECVKIKIGKETKGQFFPDLDLTTKLLARLNESEGKEKDAKNRGAGPLIQELDIDNNDIATSNSAAITEGEKFDWEVSQTEAEQPKNLVEVAPDFKYGFNNTFSEIIGVSVSNGNDINELGDPEHTLLADRINERLIKENIKFDPEYYAADYIMAKYPSPDDDKNFKQLIDWKSPTTKKFMKWYKAQQELSEDARESIMNVEFSKEEQEKLLDLPRKSYLIEDPVIQKQLLLLLISLLFAYHFDMRETEGDHNIESAWTVGKLTPQISFLDAQLDNSEGNVLKAGVITSIRRALSYPLHRNYTLVQKCWDDVYYNLRGGKRLIIKSLLDLRELFRFHDVYYVYNKIWIDDLCSWIISDAVGEGLIRQLAHDLKKEYSGLLKADITFEKLNEDKMQEDDGEGLEQEQGQFEDDDDDDEIVALNLEELELMAEHLFQEYQNA